MLVFEQDREHDTIEIHCTRDALRDLGERLIALSDRADDHLHLMTPAWAGTELTEELMDGAHELINKVTIYCWTKPPSTK